MPCEIVFRLNGVPRPPAAFAAPVKKALAVIEPAQPVIGIRTMDDVKNESLASRRNPTLLLTAFAVLALTLAAVGIAGVVGYTVVQRSPEIGVRMALGAQPADVLRLIVVQSLTWVGVGLVAGVAAALAASRLVASLLYEVQPTDPIVLALATAALATVAILIKQEILLALVGGVFVLEAASVVVQVASFKLTGKRVFRMAPLHHHFELLGWQEPKVIARFLIVSIIFALFSLTTLKLR